MELYAKPRTELGKKVKALRRAGFLPAVVYGEGTTAEPISIPLKDFEKIYQEVGESMVFELVTNGEKRLNVMIQDVKHDPLTSKPIHVDFYSVRMDKPIEAKISLVFIGESPAIKNDGGILVKVMQELEVSALPKDLPHELAVDLNQLGKIGDRIYVKNILIPRGVKIIAGEDDIICLVEPPRAEEELKVVEEAALTLTEVKTEREAKLEEKKEKEGEEKEIS